MKVYIDCGSYNGEDINQVINEGKINNTWRIIAFDPQTELNMPDIEFIKKAVWINDEQKEFAISENKVGSSLMPEKRQFNEPTSQKIMVDCIDFSEYIKQFKNDYLVIKMDIEGAEYPVLTKMIKDGTISIPKKVYVEWHCTRDPDLKGLHSDLVMIMNGEKIKKIHHLRNWINY